MQARSKAWRGWSLPAAEIHGTLAGCRGCKNHHQRRWSVPLALHSQLVQFCAQSLVLAPQLFEMRGGRLPFFVLALSLFFGMVELTLSLLGGPPQLAGQVLCPRRVEMFGSDQEVLDLFGGRSQFVFPMRLVMLRMVATLRRAPLALSPQLVQFAFDSRQLPFDLLLSFSGRLLAMQVFALPAEVSQVYFDISDLTIQVGVGTVMFCSFTSAAFSNLALAALCGFALAAFEMFTFTSLALAGFCGFALAVFGLLTLISFALAVFGVFTFSSFSLAAFGPFPRFEIAFVRVAAPFDRPEQFLGLLFQASRLFGPPLLAEFRRLTEHGLCFLLAVIGVCLRGRRSQQQGRERKCKEAVHGIPF